MKVYRILLTVFAVFLGLLALANSAPAPDPSTELLDVRAAPAPPKIAEQLLQVLLDETKALNKKYSALLQPNFGDIKAWAKELRALVKSFIANCNADDDDAPCNIVDLPLLCKLLALLLGTINSTLAGMAAKGNGLLGLDGLFMLILGLIMGDMIASILGLVTGLLNLSGSTGLLTTLGPLLQAQGLVGSILALLGLFDGGLLSGILG